MSTNLSRISGCAYYICMYEIFSTKILFISLVFGFAKNLLHEKKGSNYGRAVL